jgi:hypothetical protein
MEIFSRIFLIFCCCYSLLTTSFRLFLQLFSTLFYFLRKPLLFSHFLSKTLDFFTNFFFYSLKTLFFCFFEKKENFHHHSRCENLSLTNTNARKENFLQRRKLYFYLPFLFNPFSTHTTQHTYSE